MLILSSRLLTGATLALATALVFSLATAATKYTAAFVSIEQIILVQYLACVLFMLPFMPQGRMSSFKATTLVVHLTRSLAGWLSFYMYYLAVDRIPLADASILRSAGPLFVPLLLFFWKGYRMPLLRWLPVIIGFFGIVLVLRPRDTSLSLYHLLALGAALSVAVSIVTTRTLTRTEPVSRILFYYFFISTCFSIPLALSNWQPVPLFAVPFMIGIGFSILLTMWLYTLAYRFAKATAISPIGYSGVLFTSIIGWLIWNQIPSRSAIFGALLIISGGLGALYLSREKILV